MPSSLVTRTVGAEIISGRVVILGSRAMRKAKIISRKPSYLVLQSDLSKPRRFQNLHFLSPQRVRFLLFVGDFSNRFQRVEDVDPNAKCLAGFVKEWARGPACGPRSIEGSRYGGYVESPPSETRRMGRSLGSLASVYRALCLRFERVGCPRRVMLWNWDSKHSLSKS